MSQQLIWDYFQDEGCESFSGSIPRLKFLLNQAEKLVNNHSNSVPTVLNIGVGNGWLEKNCLSKGWNTYSLDPSEVAIKKIEENGGQGKVGMIENIPYDYETFDVIFCSEVLEHLKDEQLDLGLKEINRVLVKGGYLMGTVPFNENLQSNQVVCPDCGKLFHRWGHHQSFNIHSLTSKLSINTNLQIERIKAIYFFSWLSLNWKGKLMSLIKKTLSILGVHGNNENILFIVRKLA
ncbi:MAG TPA: hypothetical protein DCF68_22755 [Cyanothece sp. UBA12306]|nr:hypothetical protein [Cyanothece sp. UBA12306]